MGQNTMITVITVIVSTASMINPDQMSPGVFVLSNARTVNITSPHVCCDFDVRATLR